jgi:hypothetical protein
MHALLHPALSNGKLLRKIILSFNDTMQEEKELHYKTLTKYLWQTIEGLAEHVAFKKLTNEIEVEKENNMPTAPEVPKAKKQ